MSDFSEKLLAPTPSDGGRARQRFEQLAEKPLLVLDHDAEGIYRVERYSMDKVTTWRRISGRGVKAIFELEGSATA